MTNDERRSPESAPQFGGWSSKSALPAEAVEPIAEAARETGVEVYHAEFSGRELRVQVESDAGTTVDTCTDYSRALTPRLDAVNFMHRQYKLEVSTPGIERKLYQPQDYAKAVGKHVKALVRGGWVEGVLEAAGPNGISLRTPDAMQNAKGKMQNRRKGSRTQGIQESSDGLESSNPGPLESCRKVIAYSEIREAQIRVPDSELFARSRAERN